MAFVLRRNFRFNFHFYKQREPTPYQVINACSLIKGITPKIRMSCFVLITSVLLNLLCVWSVNQRLLRNRPGSGSCNLSRLLAQTITKGIHSCKPASQNCPTQQIHAQAELRLGQRERLYDIPWYLIDVNLLCSSKREAPSLVPSLC